MPDAVTTTRRRLLGFIGAIPVAAVGAKAPARQAEMFQQLSREEINRPGMGTGIERDACMIEVRLALHEYRIRHGKGHWRQFMDEKEAAR